MLLPQLLRRGTGMLTLVAAFFACEGEPITPSSPEAASPALPSAEPHGSSPVAFTHYPNPVYSGDFPDPFLLVADSGYYAYATNHAGVNVPMMHSSDLVTWSPMGDAMPSLPPWTESGKRLTWAPAVIEVGRKYLLLYTARDRQSGLQCIGRAVSPVPTGPFHDDSSGPFICQSDLGGSIDASVVRDSSGQIYVIWKNDGNCCDKPVTLWSQRFDSAGGELVGPRATLLHRDQPWEGPLIEAPTLWQQDGAWHLLYSANMWNTENYAIGYARCASPMGPCSKTVQPVLRSDAETAGPGGAEVFTDHRGLRWVAYHGWTAGTVGYRKGGVRSLRLDRINLANAQSTPSLTISQSQ
jgi:beta-xylosidase